MIWMSASSPADAGHRPPCSILLAGTVAGPTPRRAMMMDDPSAVRWRKSSWSHENGCVEVAFIRDTVAVRDSKKPNGPVLEFTAHEWVAFLSGVRAGELDLPDQYV
jgi:hypothetical protein